MPPVEIIEDLVTTIIPVHNRPEMIREAVASVLAQTHRAIELIVVDDASSDDTPVVCAELAVKHPKVMRIVTLDVNGGPGVAREAGRLRARGEFIQYLDSDDVLLPEKFGAQVAALRAKPECGVAYGMTTYRNLDTCAVERPLKRTGECINAMFPAFLQSRWWSTSTPLFRRSVTDLAGPWTPLSQEEDWEYDCRIASLGTKLAYCRQFVSETRDHGQRRLSRNALGTRRRLIDRAAAHAMILQHARRAGIDNDIPEMQQFSRGLFLLARQCGAAGLSQESKMLLGLSRESSIATMRQRAQFTTYRSLAATLGWRNAARIAHGYDFLRGRLRSRE